MTGGARAPAATPAALDGLRAIPYLRGLPEVELRRLAARCRVRPVGRGEVLFAEGARAAGLLVILAGRVKLVRTSARGREQVLHAEGPGATLGEVPVLDGGGYVASAVAVEPGRVLVVPRETLLALCRRRPAVALGVVTVLARRVRAFASLVEDLALRDVTARVARFVAGEAARSGGADVTLPGTREEIAARVGTVRELVSRALSRLQAAGVVRLRGRRLRVLDRGRLAALASGDRG